LLLGSLTAAVAGALIVRSSLATDSRTAATRHSRPTPEQSKSDDMDLLVALHPKIEREPEVESPQERAASQAVPLRVLPAPRQLEAESEPPWEGSRRWREAAPHRPQATSVETCKVVLWRGHLKYQLYVASLAEDAGWRPLAISPFFGLGDEDVPTEQATTALKRLIQQLEREDWTVVSEGSRWYDVKLERPRE
jgi:hypothetical protein